MTDTTIAPATDLRTRLADMEVGTAFRVQGLWVYRIKNPIRRTYVLRCERGSGFPEAISCVNGECHFDLRTVTDLLVALGAQ